MVTYVLLNVVFVLVVAAVFGVRPQPLTKRALFILGAMLALTAIFDSLLVGLHIVDYVDGHILGLAIGLAPIEDYFYPLLAVILIPALWKRYGGKRG